MVTNLPTIIFYTIIVISTCVFAALSQKRKLKSHTIFGEYYETKIFKTLLAFSFIIPWLVSSLRYNVGADYFNYINMYHEIYSSGFIESLLSLRSEPGYILLNSFVAIIFNNSQYIFFASSFITLFFVYKSIINKSNYINAGLSILVYMTLFYFGSLTTVRLSIAVAIILYSYKFLETRNFKKHFLYVILASCFHFTALGILPISYLISKKYKFRISFYIYCITFIIILVFGFEPITSFILGDTKYSAYLNDYESINLTTKNLINIYLLKLPLLFIVIFFKGRLESLFKGMNLYIKLFFLEFILTLFLIQVPLIDRFLLYLSISHIIIIPSIITVANKNEKPIIFIYFFYYILLRFYLFELDYPPIIPYQVFW